VTTTGFGRVPCFRRWYLCQRVLTKQQDSRPRPILGRAYQSLRPNELDGVYPRFAFANPSIQPSAFAGLRLPASHKPLAGSAYPQGWLHCQRAQHPAVTGYAPRLGYRWLDTWAGKVADAPFPSIADTACARVDLRPEGRYRCFLPLYVGGRPATDTTSRSHAWEAPVLPLNYTREGRHLTDGDGPAQGPTLSKRLRQGTR